MNVLLAKQPYLFFNNQQKWPMLDLPFVSKRQGTFICIGQFSNNTIQDVEHVKNIKGNS